ncbi:uncharacterized protein LOC132193905 [Neocloeon triangulifer]|uniref:uncharacterized protein LOC132193905 n=1 Tax=Neocloeon triangulifer TaxID=2078957 RepID=UPI00286EB694|nr:uncharacterized protein LOC132193905 [Neocloeon triangulifer]
MAHLSAAASVGKKRVYLCLGVKPSKVQGVNGLHLAHVKCGAIVDPHGFSHVRDFDTKFAIREIGEDRMLLQLNGCRKVFEAKFYSFMIRAFSSIQQTWPDEKPEVVCGSKLDCVLLEAYTGYVAKGHISELPSDLAGGHCLVHQFIDSGNKKAVLRRFEKPEMLPYKGCNMKLVQSGAIVNLEFDAVQIGGLSFVPHDNSMFGGYSSEFIPQTMIGKAQHTIAAWRQMPGFLKTVPDNLLFDQVVDVISNKVTGTEVHETMMQLMDKLDTALAWRADVNNPAAVAANPAVPAGGAGAQGGAVGAANGAAAAAAAGEERRAAVLEEERGLRGAGSSQAGGDRPARGQPRMGCQPSASLRPRCPGRREEDELDTEDSDEAGADEETEQFGQPGPMYGGMPYPQQVYYVFMGEGQGPAEFFRPNRGRGGQQCGHGGLPFGRGGFVPPARGGFYHGHGGYHRGRGGRGHF